MTNLIDFAYKELESEEGPQGKNFDGSVYANCNALIDSVIRYHLRHSGESSRYVLETRSKLAEFGKTYLEKLERVIDPDENSRRVLDQIREKTTAMSESSPGKAMLLMSAHQPNLFAYSGVMKKIILLGFLAASIEGRMKEENKDIGVICFFGFADHDFAHNKWVRSAEIESPIRKEGLLRLNVKIDQRDMYLPANKVPKPALSQIESWEALVRNWILETTSLAKKYARKHPSSVGLEDLEQIEKTPLSNFESFWRLVRRIHEVSGNLAEFSSLLLAAVTVNCFQIPIVFANFSDCFGIFGREYEWLISQSSPIRGAIKENEARLVSAGIDSGLSDDMTEISPLWRKCQDCGSKFRLQMEGEMCFGKCIRCEKENSFSKVDLVESVRKSPELFEPRSIFMPITFSKAASISCYLGGAGGLGYLSHSRAVCARLGCSLPPTPFWYSQDEYLTIQRLVVFEELQRIMNVHCIEATATQSSESDPLERGFVRAISAGFENAMKDGRVTSNPVSERDHQLLRRITDQDDKSSNSCMIDYVTNISLEKAGNQWEQFLKKDGRLFVPVKLRSFLDFP